MLFLNVSSFFSACKGSAHRAKVASVERSMRAAIIHRLIFTSIAARATFFMSQEKTFSSLFQKKAARIDPTK